ncbi:Histone-lysine N-methyltransferase, variant 2 [Balamuthia mandrillaris]
MWKRRQPAAGPTAAPLSDHNPTSADSPLAGWSDARKRAYVLLDSNPNAYYYRFNAPGEMPRYGPWSEEEKKLFLSKLAESEGEVKQWGLFSRSIPGRVGYQCSNYYRLLVQRGELQSSSYVKDDEGQIHYVGKQSGNGRRGGPNKGCPMTHGLATQPHTSSYSSDPLFHGTGKKLQSKKKSNKKCKPRGIQPKEALSSVVFPSSSESLADERQAASLNAYHLHSPNGGRLIETQQQTSFLKKMVTVEHLPPQNFIHLTFKEASGNQSDFAGSHIPISHLELCCLCGSSGIGKDQVCLLWCHDCSECYHSYCLSTELHLYGDKKRHWRCPDCKVCEVCKDPGDEDRLLVCERCDDGFHTFCLQPPLLEIPSGTWYCDSCADNPPAIVTESSDIDFDRLPQRVYARVEDKRSAPKAHLHATNRLLEQPRISMTREQQRQFEGLLFDLYEMQAQIASLDYRSDLAGLSYEDAEPFGKNDRAVEEERENEAEATLKQDVDQRPVLEDRCCFCCSCCPDVTPQPLLAPPMFAIGKNDSRECTFCGQRGDCMPCQEGRLLPLTTDKWCHVNCARWSSEVYACPDGGLMNVEKAAMRGRNMRCSHCGNKGATIGCAVAKCSKTYHFMCARQAGCLFLSNNCTFCAEDAQTRSTQSLLDAPLLPRQQALFRRVYVLRKTKVLATSLPDDDTLLELKKEDPTLFSENGTIPYSVASQPLVYERRVGGLTLSFLGIIVYEYPAFHSDTTLYPVGFKSIRTFWSMIQPWKKCAYTNEIHFDRRNNSPVFIVTPLDGGKSVVASSPAGFCAGVSPIPSFAFSLFLVLPLQSATYWAVARVDEWPVA